MGDLILRFWIWRKPSLNQVPPSVMQVKIKLCLTREQPWNSSDVRFFALKFNPTCQSPAPVSDKERGYWMTKVTKCLKNILVPAKWNRWRNLHSFPQTSYWITKPVSPNHLQSKIIINCRIWYYEYSRMSFYKIEAKRFADLFHICGPDIISSFSFPLLKHAHSIWLVLKRGPKS